MKKILSVYLLVLLVAISFLSSNQLMYKNENDINKDGSVLVYRDSRHPPIIEEVKI